LSQKDIECECPFGITTVIDSRNESDGQSKVRKRKCKNCGNVFYTFELLGGLDRMNRLKNEVEQLKQKLDPRDLEDLYGS